MRSRQRLPRVLAAVVVTVMTLTLLPASQAFAAGSVVVVRHIGSTGEEQMRIVIDGRVVDTFRSTKATGSFWGAPSNWQEHRYRHPNKVTASQVRIEFTNNGRSSDGGDRNVRVDHLRLDGTIFETEAPDVISNGSWGNGSRCSEGSYRNDNLACSGYIQYTSSGTERPPVVAAPQPDPVVPDPAVPDPAVPDPTGSTLVVAGFGTSGEERLELVVDGVGVATLRLAKADGSFYGSSTPMPSYTYTHPSRLAAGDISVRFVNNGTTSTGIDRNVRIGHIELDGVAYETEDAGVVGRGVYIAGRGCIEGNLQTEILHCNGSFSYGGEGTPTTNRAPTTNQPLPKVPVETSPTEEKGPTHETSPTEGFGGRLVVRHIGQTGEEQIRILVDGAAVETVRTARATGSFWGNPTNWQEHEYLHDGPLSPSQVRIEFVNNGSTATGADRNIRVDRIEIDGVAYETEAPGVTSNGGWGKGSTCSKGRFQIDNLVCNGYIQYVGESTGTTGTTGTGGGGGTGTPVSPAVDVVKIATLGDSNTVSGYWRKPFQQALRARQCSYDMLGTTAVNWPSVNFDTLDRDTDASSGAVIATFRNPGNAIFKHGASTLASGEADIAIVAGGTNDMQGLDLSRPDHRTVLNRTIGDTQRALLEAAAASPGTSFYVVSIPHIQGKAGNVDEFNRRLAAAVADIQDQMKVTFVSVPTSNGDIGSDGLHFTIAGGQKYGQAIADATRQLVEDFGVCS